MKSQINNHSRQVKYSSFGLMQGSFFLVALFLLASPVYSQEFHWEGYADGNVNLTTSCKLGGNVESFCDSNTYCNISELYDLDAKYTLKNVTMTRLTDGDFNYTQNLDAGFYTMKTICTNGSLQSVDLKRIIIADQLLIDAINNINSTIISNYTSEQIWSYVLGSGETANTTVSQVYDRTTGLRDFSSVIAIFVLAGVLLFAGIYLPDEHILIKYVLMVMSFIGMLFGINSARISADSLGASANLIQMLTTTYIILFVIFLIVAVWMTINLISSLIEYNKWKKEFGNE